MGVINTESRGGFYIRPQNRIARRNGGIQDAPLQNGFHKNWQEGHCPSHTKGSASCSYNNLQNRSECFYEGTDVGRGCMVSKADTDSAGLQGAGAFMGKGRTVKTRPDGNPPLP